MKRKVIAYIDGFNIYHAMDTLKNKGKLTHTYVNLWALLESEIKPEEELVAVKYFSAYSTWIPKRLRRHERYVEELKQVGVTPIISHFKKKRSKCLECKTTWTSHEEKETDVRIAIETYRDAVNDNYDRAYVVSADSDLVPPIKITRNDFPEKGFVVLTPPNRFSSARDLGKSAHAIKEIRPKKIEDNLLDISKIVIKK